MNPLDQFLNRVARELRSMPNWKREEELRELCWHLEQRVEDFEAQGSKHEEAQAQAVGAFGSPKALGLKLCDAWEGVPTNWRGVVAVMLKTIAIWLAAIMVMWIPLIVVSHIASLPASTPISAYPLTIFVILIEVSVSVYCGILLSILLGRRGPTAVLAVLLLLGFLYDGMLVLGYSTQEENIVLRLCSLMFFSSPLWLLGAVFCRIMRVRRLRDLPPGEKPNTKGNIGFVSRFKLPKR